MSTKEALGTVTNIEAIHATHVVTQTYGVWTQWKPQENQQDTIQTTHKIGDTTSTCEQSLFVLWKTKPHSWCLSKETCSTCSMCHNFYHYPRTWREGKQGHPVSIRTVKLDFNASCVQNNPTLSLELTFFFVAHHNQRW